MLKILKISRIRSEAVRPVDMAQNVCASNAR